MKMTGVFHSDSNGMLTWNAQFNIGKHRRSPMEPGGLGNRHGFKNK